MNALRFVDLSNLAAIKRPLSHPDSVATRYSGTDCSGNQCRMSGGRNTKNLQAIIRSFNLADSHLALHILIVRRQSRRRPYGTRQRPFSFASATANPGRLKNRQNKTREYAKTFEKTRTRIKLKKAPQRYGAPLQIKYGYSNRKRTNK